ncbi:D-beta-hydroxybutyrate dehydrogenase, mitochondrial isoform X2 [Pimephales promelas]|uniref:D-beta-hydroxybutyrate dehydrogenase, mitochondrial isoform X2 n=1 Tax=Pimephales promelas TaxID=90988 RepID=UPI001955833C|nr:D-beta-hydroxybutyrate dehydrogenase, mitochondrial isoform X2 [Pimephales promelas]KAG1925579.1 17-beta-hydroxysteroid dehydrogenase type [Pimephales promelas]
MKPVILSMSVLLISYICWGDHICMYVCLGACFVLLANSVRQAGRGLSDGDGRAVLVTGPGAQRLVEEGSDRMNVLQLDVTKDEHVSSAKDFVEANLPKKGLYAVVNNAGISDWGETEWSSAEDFQKMADVNLFGAIRVTIPFLSLVRASKGRMLYVSSIFSFFNCLNMGAYSVSKRGLEAFADCLRVEMASFGVKVSIIQPGNFGGATNILRRKTPQDIWDGFDHARKLKFNQKYIDMACEYFQSVCASGFKDCTLVIDAMLHALTAPRPRTRYLLVSWTDLLFFYIYPILPTCVTDSVFLASSMYYKRKAMLYS